MPLVTIPTPKSLFVPLLKEKGVLRVNLFEVHQKLIRYFYIISLKDTNYFSVDIASRYYQFSRPINVPVHEDAGGPPVYQQIQGGSVKGLCNNRPTSVYAIVFFFRDLEHPVHCINEGVIGFGRGFRRQLYVMVVEARMSNLESVVTPSNYLLCWVTWYLLCNFALFCQLLLQISPYRSSKVAQTTYDIECNVQRNNGHCRIQRRP